MSIADDLTTALARISALTAEVQRLERELAAVWRRCTAAETETARLKDRLKELKGTR